MTELHDYDLPFIIKPENVARYEDGHVFILDRRIFPFEISFVDCASYEETAVAIEEMVTQSAGPGFAAGYGMVQAALEAGRRSRAEAAGVLVAAANRLVSTRPTANEVRRAVTRMLAAAEVALEEGVDPEDALLKEMRAHTEEQYALNKAIGAHGASLLSDGDTVLTHCWAEGGIVFTLLEAQRQNIAVEAVCTETRPYLQGSRLTADAIAEMGIPTKVITDGMPGSLLSRGEVSVFMTGADRVTMSGHVVNKVGTMPIALTARHYGVPFYAFSSEPDKNASSPDDVEIEERDPTETLHCRNQRTATQRAEGLYMAFDITPPEAVSGIVTPRGVFSTDRLTAYHSPGASRQAEYSE